MRKKLKNRTKSYQLIFILVILGSLELFHATSIAGDNEWKAFLDHPSQATGDNLKNNISAPKDIIFYKFERLVQSGDKHAVDIAIYAISYSMRHHIFIFDGGNLEDILRALGRLSENNLVLLLESIKKNNAEGKMVEYIFTMLPLETVDNIDAKINVVKSRINSLLSVDNKKYKAEIDQAINALKSELEELEKLKDKGL